MNSTETERVSNKQSVYSPGSTARFVARLREDDTNRETIYGVERFHAVQYTLAGGGPAADLTLLFRVEDEPHEGWVTYNEGDGTAVVHLGQGDAEELYRNLMRDPAEADDV